MTPDEVTSLPWIRCLRPLRSPRLQRLSSHSPLMVWHVEVEFKLWPVPPDLARQWTDENANAAATWRKRPLAVGEDSGCAYSCGEVELAARLRGGGFNAYWVSEWSGFPHVDCWSAYCVKRSELRQRLGEVWRYDQELRAGSAGGATPLGSGGGHPDVVAWEGGSKAFVYLEFKGPGDSIKPKQNAWAQRVIEREEDRLPYVVVHGAFVGNGNRPPEPRQRSSSGSAPGADPDRRLEECVPPQEHSGSDGRRSSPPTPRVRDPMHGDDKLHRRTIRAALGREMGWMVDSHVDGSVDVWLPSGSIDAVMFEEEVQRAVTALGYDPETTVAADRTGRRYIRIYTEETRAQSGRGAHAAGEGTATRGVAGRTETIEAMVDRRGGPSPERIGADEGGSQATTNRNPRGSAEPRTARPGDAVVTRIKAIKYGGRLVILEDGSRWEVDELDEATAELWEVGGQVVVLDGEMSFLDDAEKVSVVAEE
jgi:hypothetical protein